MATCCLVPNSVDALTLIRCTHIQIITARFISKSIISVAKPTRCILVTAIVTASGRIVCTIAWKHTKPRGVGGQWQAIKVLFTRALDKWAQTSFSTCFILSIARYFYTPRSIGHTVAAAGYGATLIILWVKHCAKHRCGITQLAKLVVRIQHVVAAISG